MTLEELESTLPNRLHDAQVECVVIDYEQRTATLDVEVWVGDKEDPPERRKAYKNGRIEISGLLFLVVEPPDPKYPFSRSGLTINGCDARKNLGSELLQTLPADCFFRSLWVDEWNAFIHNAAKNVDVVWTNDGAITYRAS
jgi:hypothetical protein